MALGKITEEGNQKVIGALFAMLSDQNRDVAESACEALASVTEKGDQKVIGVLFAMLEGQDLYLRKSACRSLGTIAEKGNQKVIDALLAKLDDQDGDVKKAACEVLGKITVQGDQKVISILLAKLEKLEAWNINYASEVFKNILLPVWKEYLHQLKQYFSIVTDEEVIKVIIHNKGLDICFGDEWNATIFPDTELSALKPLQYFSHKRFISYK
jgi:uncharacterized ParB-like nuclease family protein